MSVLLCYDGSPSARHALVAGVATLGDHDVTLLNVWGRSQAFLPDAFADPGIDVETTSLDLDALAFARASEIVLEGQRLAAEHGIDARVCVRPSGGSDWETILATADELEADVIVVGAHPRGRPGPTLDSVSDQVIGHSHHPVLVVPSP